MPTHHTTETKIVRKKFNNNLTTIKEKYRNMNIFTLLLISPTQIYSAKNEVKVRLK